MALVPIASKIVAVDPASVVTTPAGVQMRMRWLLVSAMYAILDASTAMPSGALNRAFVPVPSVEPVAVAPASVVVKPPI